MTAPQTRAEMDADFIVKAQETRAEIALTAARTKVMNEKLSNLNHYDHGIQRGYLYTVHGEVQTALCFNGLEHLTLDGEPVERVRESLRAYGEYLILVAGNAL